jgi:hypothetical protein
MGRFTPSVEPLEERRVPSTYTQSLAQRAAWVRHEEHVFDGKLQQIELNSRATPAQELALRDDARAISAEASGTTLDPTSANAKAVEATLILDHAPLDGWVGEPGWLVIRERLDAALQGLVDDPQLLDRTIADMRSLSDSAGVTYDAYSDYAMALDRYHDDALSLRSSGYHFPDPNVYYTQHLRGCFRGGAIERGQAKANLEGEVQSVAAASGDTVAETALLRRDVQVLETLAAGLTTESAARLAEVYAAAFDEGEPFEASLLQLRTSLTSILGSSQKVAQEVDRLVADAPQFFRAAGSSPDAIRRILGQVQAFVATGGATPLNPFLITVTRAWGMHY